jgi:gliding motility-associated-like protein
MLDGVSFSNTQQPVFTAIAEGQHRLQVTVTSDYNCGPPATAASVFSIKPKPEIATTVDDGCVGQALVLHAKQNDNKTSVAQWNWDFGDGDGAGSPSVSHNYRSAGQYVVQLWTVATNGCSSDTLRYPTTINEAIASAGRDTAVIKDFPFQLHGVGNGNFLWSPATGLTNPSIADPVATLSNDQQYTLTVTTAEGCQASDTILIKTFKGPAIYVPSAFTPNSDGRNDILKPVYVGIKELKQFSVFNRWGQVIFTTADKLKGWEGINQPPGTYVWLVRAIDTNNQIITLKGTVTIIR